MRRTVYVLISIVLLSTLPLAFSQSTDNSTDSYSISGTVYDADGQLAGSTSIKLSVMNQFGRIVRVTIRSQESLAENTQLEFFIS